VSWHTGSGWSALVSAGQRTPRCTSRPRRVQARPGTEPAWRPPTGSRRGRRTCHSLSRSAVTGLRSCRSVTACTRVRRFCTRSTSSAKQQPAARALGRVYKPSLRAAKRVMRRCGPRLRAHEQRGHRHPHMQSNSIQAGDVPGDVRDDYRLQREVSGGRHRLQPDGRQVRPDLGRPLMPAIGRPPPPDVVRCAHPRVNKHPDTVGVALSAPPTTRPLGASKRRPRSRRMSPVYARPPGTSTGVDGSRDERLANRGTPRPHARLYRVMGSRDPGRDGTDCPGKYLYADSRDPVGRPKNAHLRDALHESCGSVRGNHMCTTASVTVRARISKIARWTIVNRRQRRQNDPLAESGTAGSPEALRGRSKVPGRNGRSGAGAAATGDVDRRAQRQAADARPVAAAPSRQPPLPDARVRACQAAPLSRSTLAHVHDTAEISGVVMRGSADQRPVKNPGPMRPSAAPDTRRSPTTRRGLWLSQETPTAQGSKAHHKNRSPGQNRQVERRRRQGARTAGPT